jgi:hypothetical protein
LESGTDSSSNSTNDEPGNTKQWRIKGVIVPLDVPGLTYIRWVLPNATDK